MNHFDSRKFGENLINLRKAKEYTQENLANEINVNKNTISRLENGDIPQSVLCLIKIFEALDIDFNDLISSHMLLNEISGLSTKGTVITMEIIKILKEKI